jgi:acetyl-CoA carboxylase biotin carboxyl carrier protein
LAQPGTAEKMNDQESQNAGDELQPEGEVTVDQGSAERRRGRRRRTARPEIPVNMDELRELINLIRENEFTEFELEREGFRVRFRRGAEVSEQNFTQPQSSGASQTQSTATAAEKAASVPSHPGARAQTEASEDQYLHVIPSPIVGTFYRAPSPTAEVFVKIGSSVEPDTVVCIIEAMKLMNEIQAETTGEVVKIYVENGQPVEYGQPLFGIKK